MGALALKEISLKDDKSLKCLRLLKICLRRRLDLSLIGLELKASTGAIR